MNKKRAIAIFRHEEVRLEKRQSADGFGSTAGFRGRVGQCRLAEDCRHVRFHRTSCNPEVLDNLSVTDPRRSREPTPHVRAEGDQRDRGLWTRITVRSSEESLKNHCRLGSRTELCIHPSILPTRNRQHCAYTGIHECEQEKKPKRVRINQ
jgi:hypothetical protein